MGKILFSFGPFFFLLSSFLSTSSISTIFSQIANDLSFPFFPSTPIHAPYFCISSLSFFSLLLKNFSNKKKPKKKIPHQKKNVPEFQPTLHPEYRSISPRAFLVLPTIFPCQNQPMVRSSAEVVPLLICHKRRAKLWLSYKG